LTSFQLCDDISNFNPNIPKRAAVSLSSHILANLFTDNFLLVVEETKASKWHHIMPLKLKTKPRTKNANALLSLDSDMN
jgi:hypothetical protein